MVHTKRQHRFNTKVKAQKDNVTSYNDVNSEAFKKSNRYVVINFSSAGVIFNRKTRDSRAKSRDTKHNSPKSSVPDIKKLS